MNNEPVAWIARGDNTSVFFDLDCALSIDDSPTPLYTHPAKELHLSLQKSKETGELLAVTYTDDEHRIVEVLWKRPPAKTLTDEDLKKCRAPLLEHSMACLYQGFLSHYGYEHSKQLCEAFFYPTGKTNELHNELVCRKNSNYFDKSCEKCNTAILRKSQEK